MLLCFMSVEVQAGLIARTDVGRANRRIAGKNNLRTVVAVWRCVTEDSAEDLMVAVGRIAGAENRIDRFL